jgi:hypothetical protein
MNDVGTVKTLIITARYAMEYSSGKQVNVYLVGAWNAG